MKSFKDYSKTTQTPQEENLTAEELTERLTSAYEGKSDLEMLKNILQEAEKSKRAGTLTNAEIDEFYAQFAPMLDGGQRKQLEGVVQRLKDI